MMATLGEVKYAKVHILEKAYNTLVAKLATDAEQHQHGKGIGTNLHFQGLRSARRRLVKEGQATAVVALDHLAVGALWDPADREPGTLRHEHYCHRCGMRAVATKIHDFYLCPDNVHVDAANGVVDVKTANLIKEGIKEADRHPCLWLRGLIPSTLVDDSPRPTYEETQVRMTPNLTELLERTRHGFSDGSGGLAESVASQRRVHSGAATYRLDEDGNNLDAGGLVAEVPGKQTVPRAELWGAALLINAAPSSGPFEVTLDAAYVVDGLAKCGDRLRSANGDLWTILAKIIEGRDGDTCITKVKSHVLRDHVDQVASRQHLWRHVIGNELADAAADTGPALFTQEVGAASRRARDLEDKAAEIAHRIARIQARIWDFNRGSAVCEAPTPTVLDPEEQEPGRAAQDMISAINSRGHQLEGWGNGFRCTRCGIRRGWKNRDYWTKTKCRPHAPAGEVAKRLRVRYLPDPASGSTFVPHRVYPDDVADSLHDRVSTQDHDEDYTTMSVCGIRANFSDDDGDCTRLHLDPVANDGASSSARETNVVIDALQVQEDPEDLKSTNFEHRISCTENKDTTAGFIQDTAFHTGDYNALDVCGSTGAGDAAQVQGAVNEYATAGQAAGGTNEHMFDSSGEEDIDSSIAHPFSLPPEEGDLDVIGDGPQPTAPVGATTSDGQMLECGPAGVVRLVPRRRLTGKTSPTRAATLGYPPATVAQQTVAELVTMETARAARLRHREASAAHSKSCKMARTTAWQAIRRHPEVVAGGDGQTPAEYDADADSVVRGGDVAEDLPIQRRWLAHGTHDIAAAPGAQLLYCRICGSWSLGEKSMNLTRPCSRKDGHKGNLRLLSLGIAPRRGARVPAEMKLAGSRGSRGGFAVRRKSKVRRGR